MSQAKHVLTKHQKRNAHIKQNVKVKAEKATYK